MIEYDPLGQSFVAERLTSNLSWVDQRLERIGYGEIPPSDRKKIVGLTMQNIGIIFQLGYCVRPYVHPVIAIIECGLADAEIKIPRVMRLLCGFYLWYLKRQAKKHGDIPGVNDGLMVRWFWTHDPRYVKDLVKRCSLVNEIGESCRWMLESVRQRDSALDHALDSLGYFREYDSDSPTPEYRPS